MIAIHSFSRSMLWFILGIMLLALGTSRVFAQDASPASSPLPSPPPEEINDLVFPIPELDNCSNPGSCMLYCDDPVHYNQCVDYAKKKGFYKGEELHTADDEFWQEAEDELGCNSLEACLELCQLPENHNKCDAYAKDKDLVGGYIDQPDKPEYLEIAKTVLGCDSFATCSTVCDDPANADQCTEFAQQVGLLGGRVEEGPGGCTSTQTCQSFCSDPNNFEMCRPYAPPQTGGQFQGPGGCNSSTSCRSHCEENPSDCRSYAPGSNGVYVPVACGAGQYFGPGGVCTAVERTEDATKCAGEGKFWDGSSCQPTPPPGVAGVSHSAYFQPRPEMGNCKTPGQCYDWCQDNPGQCPGLKSDTPRPQDTYIPSLYYTPGTPVQHNPVSEMGNCSSPGACYDWCQDHPSECSGFDPKSPRPLDQYVPGTYYTPPIDYAYVTPPLTNYYVTPVYYTPPEGSNYTTPAYYTPGHYSTPSYYTPPQGSQYSTPTYYTPGSYYYTPSGEYPTPTYPSPTYYTPPIGSNYTTPTYYTPPQYTTPTYYTPPEGSTYTTPTYLTPPAYTTPTYYTPFTTGGTYTTPVYYTPPQYTTPNYYTPSEGSTYTTPTYHTPPTYATPQYYTPGYYTPYSTPNYYTPGGTYTSPSYATPGTYSTPGYYTPGETYSTPSYSTPGYYTPGGTYTTPSYNTPSYYTPDGTYATPTYASPSYGTPSYNTPSYATPAYNTPTYNTPTYGTPTYDTPSYGTPTYETPSYGTPSEGGSTQGASTSRSWWEQIQYYLFGNYD